MNIASQTKEINRRSIFAAIPALAATATAAHAFKMPDTPVQDDPIPNWWEQWKALRDDINKLDDGDDTLEAELHAIEEKICTTQPKTLAGAVAQLEYAMDDFGDYMLNNMWKDLDNKLFANLLGALKAGVA